MRSDVAIEREQGLDADCAKGLVSKSKCTREPKQTHPSAARGQPLLRKKGFNLSRALVGLQINNLRALMPCDIHTSRFELEPFVLGEADAPIKSTCIAVSYIDQKSQDRRSQQCIEAFLNSDHGRDTSVGLEALRIRISLHFFETRLLASTLENNALRFPPFLDITSITHNSFRRHIIQPDF